MEELIKWLEAEKKQCNENRKYWTERAAREMLDMEFSNASASLTHAEQYIVRVGVYGAAVKKARQFSTAAEVTQ